MKMFTQTTTARNTNPGFRRNMGRFSNRVLLHQGTLQRFLEALRRRLFVFNIPAPVWAYSIQGGAYPIQ